LKAKKFSILDRLKSFKFAFNGLRSFFINEHNARIHLFASICAIGLSFCLHISLLEWGMISMVIGGVVVAEIFNTSIEKLADVVSKEVSPKIKIVKDLAAAGVLIASILALIIAALIFLPKLLCS